MSKKHPQELKDRVLTMWNNNLNSVAIATSTGLSRNAVASILRKFREQGRTVRRVDPALKYKCRSNAKKLPRFRALQQLAKRPEIVVRSEDPRIKVAPDNWHPPRTVMASRE